MDKGLIDQIKSHYPMQEVEPGSYSGLPLAFIGDGIYELVIRTLVMSRGNTQVNKLHHRRAELVNAGAQSKMIQALLPELTKEEESIVRRGKNTSPHTKAKNATVEDYMWATGMEALCGWLYLKGDMDRLLELIGKGIAAIGYDIKEITGAGRE